MNTPNYSFVLVRGLIREQAHWGQFVDELRSRFPHARVEGIDLPGAGKRFQEKAPMTIVGMLKLMREDLDALKLPEDSTKVLIAVSLGGMVAGQWLQDFPEDFERAILINTSYAQFSPTWRRLKPTALAGFIPLIGKRGRAREVQILRVVSNRSDLYGRVSKEWAKIHAERPVSVENTFRQLWAAFRFKGVRQPAAKVLLMNSASDRMVDPKCSQDIAKAWDVPLVVHPTAGHDLTTDEPVWAADEIKKWLTY